MSLRGDFSAKLDIISPVVKFFEAFINDMNGTFDKLAEEKLGESIDWEKRIMTKRMSGCLISESYKMVIVTITVTPKENVNGSNVVWTVEFEKILDMQDPHFIIDTLIDVLINYLKETDKKLLL